MLSLRNAIQTGYRWHIWYLGRPYGNPYRISWSIQKQNDQIKLTYVIRENGIPFLDLYKDNLSDTYTLQAYFPYL